MTDLDIPLTPAGDDLGYDCPECDANGEPRTFPTKLRLGAHRRQAHQVAGSGRGRRASRAKGAGRGSKGAGAGGARAAAGTGAEAHRKAPIDLAGELRTLAGRWEDTHPGRRINRALDAQADDIAEAVGAMARDTEAGRKLVEVVDDEGDPRKRHRIDLAWAAAPLGGALLLDFLERVMTSSRGRRPVANPDGSPVLDQEGNPVTADRRGFLYDSRGARIGRMADAAEPAPAEWEPPPAPDPGRYVEPETVDADGWDDDDEAAGDDAGPAAEPPPLHITYDDPGAPPGVGFG